MLVLFVAAAKIMAAKADPLDLPSLPCFGRLNINLPACFVLPMGQLPGLLLK
jgi:hypothetical protein